MDAKNQFTVVCICVVAGFVFGIAYAIVAFIRMLFACPRGKNKWLGVALDIVFWLVFAVYYIVVAYAFAFPNFRVYTWVGYAVGGIIYLKTLHKVVAFLGNLCYNICKERLKKHKEKRRNSKKRIESRV